MSEIKILTGAVLCGNSELPVQIEVLKRFLTSHDVFCNLTVAEVKHAFYLNNQGAYGEMYKHYNKELNAEFMGSVLLAYVKLKRRLHTRVLPEINKKLHPQQQEAKPKITPEHMEWFIQEQYNQYLDGQQQYLLYTTRCYNYLRKCGMIEYADKSHWWKWYFRAMQHRRNKAFGQRIKELMDIYTEYDRNYHHGIPMHEHRNIMDALRHIRYLFFFKCIADCGIRNIFQEIDYKKQ